MTYKLYYFAIRGLAEPIRYIFHDKAVAFEDIQFKKDEEWFGKYKPQMAFGQVPCLKDGDFEIPQSAAILRHVARKLDLDGETDEQKTFADFFVEGVRDLHMKYVRVIYQAYETEKDQLINETFPVELAKLEKLLKIHDNGEKFVLGDRLSYADYVLYEELDIALILSPSILDAFPVLKAFHHRFGERPAIKAYTSKRNLPVNNNGKQ